MNTNTHRQLKLPLVAAILAAAALNAHAQTWQTVDDFQAVAGLGATGSDIGTDPSGILLYSVGSGITTPDGSERIAVVHVSTDQGANWNTLPEFGDPIWTWEHYRAFSSDADGRLYVGGNGRRADWPSADLGWIIRESDDYGVTWVETDDPFPFPGDNYAGCADIKVHPVTGDVYASGSSLTYGRVIRKRAAGATDFTTVYASGANDGGSGWSLSFHPDGRVFVAGDGPVSGSHPWLVLRSATGELGTWQIVDAFKTKEWTQSSARASVITDSGTIYVAGWGYSSKTRKRAWIVRSSADGGATWSISDNFSYGGTTVELSGMTLDEAGNIFVCGQVSNSAGKLSWLVRKGVPGTKLVKQGRKWVTVSTVTWSNTDLYQMVSGQPARANGITSDGLGNVFVTGRAADAVGVDHWIVRKLVP